MGEVVRRGGRFADRDADPAEGVGEHEPPDALRLLEREAENGPAAHRLADEVGAGDLEMVEQCEQIRAGDRGSGARSVIARSAEAAMIPRDDETIARECGDLLIPDRMVAAHAVAENYRRAVTADLVVELLAIRLDKSRAARDAAHVPGCRATHSISTRASSAS